MKLFLDKAIKPQGAFDFHHQYQDPDEQKARKWESHAQSIPNNANLWIYDSRTGKDYFPFNDEQYHDELSGGVGEANNLGHVNMRRDNYLEARSPEFFHHAYTNQPLDEGTHNEWINHEKSRHPFRPISVHYPYSYGDTPRTLLHTAVHHMKQQGLNPSVPILWPEKNKYKWARLGEIRELDTPMKKSQSHTGAMVAACIPTILKKRLAVEDGEDISDLHITLVYCPDVESAKVIKEVTRGIVKKQEPFKVRISGNGRFKASESSDSKDVLYAACFAQELESLHDKLSKALTEKGITVASNFAYTPHITLKYVDTDSKEELSVNSEKFMVSGLMVAQDKQHTIYPLRGFV